MKKAIFFIVTMLTIPVLSYCQSGNFERLKFLIGDWTGTGVGFGNDKSKVVSSFHMVMNGKIY